MIGCQNHHTAVYTSCGWSISCYTRSLGVIFKITSQIVWFVFFDFPPRFVSISTATATTQTQFMLSRTYHNNIPHYSHRTSREKPLNFSTLLFLLFFTPIFFIFFSLTHKHPPTHTHTLTHHAHKHSYATPLINTINWNFNSPIFS